MFVFRHAMRPLIAVAKALFCNRFPDQQAVCLYEFRKRSQLQFACSPPATAGDDVHGSAAIPPPILKSGSSHIAAALLLVKKPPNELLQGRFARRRLAADF
jgi:hypothetical protein